MSNSYHIIMADIISSRDIDKKNNFMGQFAQLTQKANDVFKDSILSPLTITLGDEFQGVVNNSKTLFELLFYLEEHIISKKYPFNLRYSMVHGVIDTKINEKIAYEMYGSGLTKAREALKTIKDGSDNYFIGINAEKDVPLKLCMKLYQSIKSNWKTSEYEVIAAFLKNYDYKEVMKTGLYKTRSGAWKKRKSLQIEEYNIVKNLVYNILENE